MPIAYVMPTRDRPQILRRTLDALAALPPHSAQVIVVDNASASVPEVPRQLDNGLTVELVRHRVNLGAAARNTGVQVSDPSCEWIVMLDDDSAPLDGGHLQAMQNAKSSVAAVAAEIFLEMPSMVGGAPKRESGGLPEVFIGCGVAIRRQAFLESGGYDPSFGYYAEEYDLAARFLLAGMRVTMDRRFRVLHRKVAAGRDMNLILQRLVRNNGWVMQRYAPARRRLGEVRHIIERYGAIARKEHAGAGYGSGLGELMGTLRRQVRTPMPGAVWDLFTGKAAATGGLRAAMAERPFSTACLVDEGKNAHVIRAVLDELGVGVVTEDQQPEALVIGTLSPGPMLDAYERRVNTGRGRVVLPWAIDAAELRDRYAGTRFAA